MLSIVIPDQERYDEERNEFFKIKGQKLQLEHSLVAISKWEAKWHIPFLTDKDKTTKQILDYVRCMTLTQNVRPEVYMMLTVDNIRDINAYIADSMTATFFSNNDNRKRYKKPVTNEVIYFWMFSYDIPKECEKWHLNRLLTLIRVFEEETKQKKPNRAEALKRTRALNAARRQKYSKR